MWDARHLTGHFPLHDACIEHTDASNDRLRLHHARASAAFAPVSGDPTTGLSVDPAAAPLCAICSGAAVASVTSEGPWHSARTVTKEDTSSAVSTDRSSTTLSVDSPAPGSTVTTTTVTDTLTETTTTTTISTTTTITTKTTKTTRSVYPRGLRPDLHALYDACARACPTGLAVCSTCRLALCVPCFVAHFPFDAHCDLVPISRAAHYHWQCPRCDHIPPLGSPLSPPHPSVG